MAALLSERLRTALAAKKLIIEDDSAVCHVLIRRRRGRPEGDLRSGDGMRQSHKGTELDDPGRHG